MRHVLISGRQATALLLEWGVPTRQGRRLLHDGFAGPALRTAGALLYDEDRVAELAARRSLTKSEIDSACPFGLFIGRRDVLLSGAREELLDSVASGWRLRTLDWLWLRFALEKHGYVPMIVSVAGFVGLGAEIISYRQLPRTGDDPAAFQFMLREPGHWFESFRERQLNLTPGGGSFSIWGLAAGARLAGPPGPFPSRSSWARPTRSRRARAARRLEDV